MQLHDIYHHDLSDIYRTAVRVVFNVNLPENVSAPLYSMPHPQAMEAAEGSPLTCMTHHTADLSDSDTTYHKHPQGQCYTYKVLLVLARKLQSPTDPQLKARRA